MTRIQAILVLYKMSLAASPSFAVMAQASLNGRSGAQGPHYILNSILDLMIADNSPTPQIPPPDFSGAYLHDGQNPGLARRYNQALDAAVKAGATWLLLLDQDTTLTVDWLAEIDDLTQRLASRQEVVGIVPRLFANGRLLSPHIPSYRKNLPPLNPEIHGLIPAPVRAFNSGALLRVAALQAIGGFPEAYWLDYLDHATMHRLQSAGGRLFITKAKLEHDLASSRPATAVNASVVASRHCNQLVAEKRFYLEHGTPCERLSHRKDLLRLTAKALRAGDHARAVRLLHAVLTPAPHGSHP